MYFFKGVGGDKLMLAQIAVTIMMSAIVTFIFFPYKIDCTAMTTVTKKKSIKS